MINPHHKIRTIKQEPNHMKLGILCEGTVPEGKNQKTQKHCDNPKW